MISNQTHALLILNTIVIQDVQIKVSARMIQSKMFSRTYDYIPKPANPADIFDYFGELKRNRVDTKRTRSIGSGRKAMHLDQNEQLFNKLKKWRKEGVPVAYSYLLKLK
jgi:hypothetical protein